MSVLHGQRMVGEILRSGTPMLQSRPLGYLLVRYLPAGNFGDGPEQERYSQADIQDNSSVSGWVIDAGIAGPAAPVRLLHTRWVYRPAGVLRLFGLLGLPSLPPLI